MSFVNIHSRFHARGVFLLWAGNMSTKTCPLATDCPPRAQRGSAHFKPKPAVPSFRRNRARQPASLAPIIMICPSSRNAARSSAEAAPFAPAPNTSAPGGPLRRRHQPCFLRWPSVASRTQAKGIQRSLPRASVHSSPRASTRQSTRRPGASTLGREIT